MSITTTFDPPLVTDSTANFNTKAFDTVGKLNTWSTEANALATAVNADADAAIAAEAAAAISEANAAASASAASATAGAVLWVSGATVNQYACVISPSTYQTYRRKTATGSGTTDPASDTTNYERITAVAIGTGGAVSVSAPITLTSASSAQQSLTATSYGAAVTLPNATTLLEGVTSFGLYNAGAIPILIKNASGTLIGFVPPLREVICALADNTTSAGAWNLSGHDLVAVDASDAVSFASAPGTTNTTMTYVALDTTRHLLLLSGQTSVHGVVWDDSAQQFGASSLIRTANIRTNIKAVKTTTGSVLVVSCTDGSTAIEAVVLSFSGSSISGVGTAAAATLAGNLLTLGELEAVGSSWMIGYSRDTTTAGIRAISVSGTTATIGAESATTGTGIAPVIYDMGSSVAVVLSQTASSNIYAKAWTVSGSSLSAGSEATITATVTGFICRSLASGRIALLYENTNRYGAIVSLSGTTPSASTVQLVAAASGTNVFAHTIGSQVIYSDATRCNVLTDNAGTAVAGTAITYSASSIGMFGFSASAMWLFVTPSAGARWAASITISGNNPVLTESSAIGANSYSLSLPQTTSLTYKQTMPTAALIGSVAGSFVQNLTGTAETLAFNGSQLLKMSLPMFAGQSALGARQDNASGWAFANTVGNKYLLQRLRAA